MAQVKLATLTLVDDVYVVRAGTKGKGAVIAKVSHSGTGETVRAARKLAIDRAYARGLRIISHRDDKGAPVYEAPTSEDVSKLEEQARAPWPSYWR